MTTEPANTRQDFMQLMAVIWPMLAVLVIVLGVYHETVNSMVEIWTVSETYAHGFIILPISFWLIWQHRQDVIATTPTTDFIALPFLIGSIMVWMLAEFVGVQVLAEFSIVSTIITATWLVIGFDTGKKLLFPLLFLLFAVPAGDSLIPPMMEFTASFTVAMIRLTGIPVFREGLFFTLPSGNWSVVEACSGVRYIIASMTLGVLFAYLNYRSLKKQLIFIVVSFLVPILANGLRAYMIVMIGHVSGMKLATGVDHLIYGWVFFGVVMLILFSIGAIWRDDMSFVEGSGALKKNLKPTLTSANLVTLGLVLLLSLGSWAYVKNLDDTDTATVEWAAVSDDSQWQRCEIRQWVWKPRYVNTSASLDQKYCAVSSSDVVAQFLGYYAYQGQGREVVNGKNKLTPFYYENNIREKVQFREPTDVRIANETVSVDAAVVERQGQKYRVWQWYRIGRLQTSSQVMAKVYEAYGKLIEGRGDALILAVATPIEKTADIKHADEVLQRYVDQRIPAIYKYTDGLLR